MCRLLLALSLFLAGSCGSSAETPAPRWTRTVTLRTTSTSSASSRAFIEMITPEALIIAADGRLLALDMRSGATLWQREGYWQPIDAYTGKPGSGDRWSVDGTAQGEKTGTVCLLMHTVQETNPNPMPPRQGASPYVSTSWFTLEGVSARSGQVLWRSESPMDTEKELCHLANGVLRTGMYDSVSRRYSLRFADAVTGKPIMPDTEAGRAQLRQILARNGGTAELDFPRQRLRADTGIIETPPAQEPPVNALNTLTQDGISVVRRDTDDDGVGHSQWPKYLIGMDAQGRQQWQYPPTLARDPETGNATKPSSSMGSMVNLPGTGVCLAVDSAQTLYGIRFRDGKVLWSKPQPARISANKPLFWLTLATPFHNGCFAIFRPAMPASGALPSLAYMEAQTGAMRPVLFGPPVWKTAVVGDTLVAQIGPGTFRAYAIPALLTSHPSGASTRPSRKRYGLR